MIYLLALIAVVGEWADVNQQALVTLKAGQFADAERLARRALAAAENDEQRAISYMNLGRVHRDAEHCEPAARAIERGVQLFEKAGDRLITMEAAAQLVSVFLECGALERARAIDQRYIDLPLARRALPPERAAQLIGNAGVIAMLRHKLTEAQALLEEALALARPIDRAVLHGTLAQVALEQKQFHAALQHSRDSLAFTETALGATHPLAVKTLANLSVIYARLGDRAQADLFHERALALAERYYESGNPLLADILYNRAQMLRDWHRKNEARPLEDRARSIRATPARPGLTGSISLLERGR